MGDLARLMILAGIGLASAGLLLLILSKIPCMGKLPGDIYIQKDNVSFYFPVVTCIIISIILSIIMNFWPRK